MSTFHVVDAQVDAAERRDAVGEQRARRPCWRPSRRCRSRRRSRSRRGPWRTSPGSGVRRASAGRRRAGPTRGRPRSPSAPVRPTTSTMRPPNTPLTPTTTVSPGPTKLTMLGLHPSRAGAGHGERERVRRGEDGAQPIVGLVEQRDELGIEMAEHRACRVPGRPRGTGCTGRAPSECDRKASSRRLYSLHPPITERGDGRGGRARWSRRRRSLRLEGNPDSRGAPTVHAHPR